MIAKETREHILAACDSLSRARDIEQRAWIDAGREGNHEDELWWRLNDIVLTLFVITLRWQ